MLNQDTSSVIVIAELSANHNGSIDDAKGVIKAAAESGADAIKIQTYTPDTLTIDCDRPEFRISADSLWDGRTLYNLYQEAFTPWDWHGELFNYAKELGIPLFSTPFDDSAVDFLESFDPPAYKIASFEMIDHGLIRRVAETQRPVIMSTGMASLEEITESVSVARAAGCEDLSLLKCTSAYPAPAEEANLARIPHMAETFGVRVGLSDHTMGSATAVTAVALGATIIEKHFTLSRDNPGPDSSFSMEPSEFREMVDAIRIAEKAVGKVTYERTLREEKSIVFRRSLFAVADIEEGQEFTEENVRSIRPGNGLAPKFLPEVLGKTASRAISRGTPLDWELIRA